MIYLDRPAIISCATCSEWTVESRGDAVRPQDVRCPLQEKMAGFHMTKQVCEQWHSEYLNDPVSCKLYYAVLYNLEDTLA